jgi:hypothetical protein
MFPPRKVKYLVVDLLSSGDSAQSLYVNASTCREVISSIQKSMTWMCFGIPHNLNFLLMYLSKKKKFPPNVEDEKLPFIGSQH